MKVTILIDRNEKRALRFPPSIQWHPKRGAKGQTVLLRTKHKVLKVGDYAIEGHEDVCLVERKGSLRELAQNLLSDDWTRAQKAFRRLADATEAPYLLLECTASELRCPRWWVPDPTSVSDALMDIVQRYGFRFLLCGSVKTLKQKTIVGELVARLLLAHVYGRENFGEVDKVIGKVSRVLTGGRRPKRRNPVSLL